MNASLTPLRNTKTILLTTYRKDGTPVSTAFDRLMRYCTMHYELVPR